MTPRRRRMVLIAAIVLGVAAAAAFALTAFQQNLLYFYSPSDVLAGKAPANRVFRVGGMVIEGSFQRPAGSMEARFVLTDYSHEVTVSYSGVLPDLFREGQGIVARGQLSADGTFVAEEVLAKHDENYMPPDVADSLRKQHDKRVTTPIQTTATGPKPLDAAASVSTAQPAATASPANTDHPSAPAQSTASLADAAR